MPSLPNNRDIHTITHCTYDFTGVFIEVNSWIFPFVTVSLFIPFMYCSFILLSFPLDWYSATFIPVRQSTTQLLHHFVYLAYTIDVL